MSRQQPPADVRRQLRKEANFGCVICGCPVIEYHHIVPDSKEEHNDPDRMVALCPTHHTDAGPHAEGLTPDQLYEYKENPHNSDSVDYDFYFESNIPVIKFSGNYGQLRERNNMIILQVADQPLIEITYEDNILKFSAVLFDEAGNMIAKLDQNEWWAATDKVWDLTRQGNQLKIWHQKREIGLEIKYESNSDLISIRGSFYVDGEHVKAYPSKTEFPGIKGKIVGHTAIDHKVFMWYTDMEGYWEVIVGCDPSDWGKELKHITDSDEF